MKIRQWIVLLFALLLVGCSQATPLASTPTSEPTAALVPPSPRTTSVPDVKSAARAYLDAWKAENYEAMYGVLTSVSQDAISKEKFVKHYQGVASEAGLSGVDYEILSSLTNPDTAQVNYRITLHSMLAGDVQRDTLMNLTLDKGQWRVQWDDTLVLPELAGGNYLGMDVSRSSRANIYDRNGKALVAQADAVAVGLYPDQIVPEQADALFAQLTTLTGLRADTIRGMYANFPQGQGWYLPLGEVSADRAASRYDIVSGFSGVVLSSYKSRYYFDGGVAPHVVGYVSAIQAEEVETYKRRGYAPDERVGRSGLEKWGEPYLAGERGGELFVFNAQGQPVTKLAERPTKPSQAIYTTIDKDFQEGVQLALGAFKGAAVVLERDTGRILAMASSPSFDPNAFEPINVNSYTQLANLATDGNQPLYNRATQGQYPLGSVFKIITMAAALNSGRYTPETPYECGYHFTELAGTTLNDWTWDHFQQDGRTMPSGLLTLSQGLMRSCNPFFWHIGLDFYNAGKTREISDMSRAFGLGSPTGIVGLDEEAGQVPDPNNPVDATNLAIGQGNLMVTPLQVVDFVAAVGNGGTLYRPQLIEKIAPPDGEPTMVFKPEVRGTLPLKPEALKSIQDAMIGVVESTKPRGTAYQVFTGLDIPVAGKTGTATSGSGEPHAWFAGYTRANRTDKPDIAIVVIGENIGEGSVYAAPIFRRIVELYYRGNPGKLYPWESTYYVTRTPTPEFEGTQTPQAATPEPFLPTPRAPRR